MSRLNRLGNRGGNEEEEKGREKHAFTIPDSQTPISFSGVNCGVMLLPLSFLLFAQSTPQAGFTLYGPQGNFDTHLVDSNGQFVHTWSGSNFPGDSVYLRPNGNLLRTYKVSGFPGSNLGGSGGGIREYSWDSAVLHDFQMANQTQQSHHDIAILPNGNVLMLTFDNVGQAAAISAGRDPSTIAGPNFWSETILELDLSTGTVVWEWSVWDHLVQDFDPTKANYNVVSDHPELFDVNFPPGTARKGDWLHCNGIDYNANFDQIVISSRAWSEIWVIDHGDSNSEILYRWGNPQAYGRGTVADQQLFNQHDPTWIPDDRPGAGNMLIFNNGTSRPAGTYSSVEEIVTPVDTNGNYPLALGAAYDPVSPVWTWTDNPPSNSFSALISGCERQPNGNTLITLGSTGHLIEADPTGKQVWDWYSPNGERIFKARRYERFFWPGDATVSIATGGRVTLDLVAGTANANRKYWIAGTLSGTSPGTDLGNGLTAPLNWDSFMDWSIRKVNGPVFNNFSGTLDANGSAAAVLDTLGPVSASYSGLTMHFAFILLKPLDFVSNAIPVALLP